MGGAIHRILAATDLSEFSPILVHEAAELAVQCRAELTVLHVYRPEEYARMFAETQVPIDEYVDHLRAELWYQVTGPGRMDIEIPFRLIVREANNVVEEILLEAARTKADVIMMGTRGRSGLARALLGSVAEAVLRRAPVPVVVVPAAVLGRPQRNVAVPAGRATHE